MAIDKAELFDLYHEAFPKIVDVIQNSWLTEAGRFRQIEEIVNSVEQKIEAAGD
jgi:hypothetical protein